MIVPSYVWAILGTGMAVLYLFLGYGITDQVWAVHVTSEKRAWRLENPWLRATAILFWLPYWIGVMSYSAISAMVSVITEPALSEGEDENANT